MNKIELVILKHILTNKTSALSFISAAEKPIELFSTDLFLLVKNIIPYLKQYRVPPTLKVLVERNPKSADEITSKYNRSGWAADNYAKK